MKLIDLLIFICSIAPNPSARIHIIKDLHAVNLHEKRPLKMDALQNTIWDKEKSKFALTHYLFFCSIYLGSLH